jgi:hypothetical protein
VRSSRFTRPSRERSRQQMKLDNIALIPASLLPDKAHWQHIANNLPDGDILIVLPGPVTQQRVAHAVASKLIEQGKHVRVMINPTHSVQETSGTR